MNHSRLGMDQSFRARQPGLIGASVRFCWRCRGSDRGLWHVNVGKGTHSPYKHFPAVRKCRKPHDHETRAPRGWEAWPGGTSPAAYHGGKQRKGRLGRRYGQGDKEEMFNKRNVPADLGLLSAWCVYDLSTRPSRCWLILTVGQDSVRTKAFRSARLVRKQIRPRATVWIWTDDIYDEADEEMTGWSNEQSVSTGAGNNCPCGWWCSASNQRKHLYSHWVLLSTQPKPFTQERKARRKTRRHSHWPSTWSETTDVPEEAGEMQVLDECRRVCLCHGQTGFSILSWPVSARTEPKI